jgi:4-hydroxybenzoate polyprenyltransferase
VDPADRINVPLRSREALRLRIPSIVVAALSALAMIVVPVLQGDRLMMLLTICGSLICINYSLSPFGLRFKDIPLLKTFFAPTLVTGAFLIPPFLQQRETNPITMWLIATAWIWCVLMFNMVLCDLRDIRGDAATGIKSLPVAIGHRRTLFGLAILIGAGALLSFAAIHVSPQGAVLWSKVSMATLLYLTILLVVVSRFQKMSEAFYEWWVEGILFVPAVVYWFAR